LVPPVDTAAFEPLWDLLGDRERMAAMGERGRQIVAERFSVRRSVEKLAELYRAVLAGKEVSRRGAEAQRD
jgi:glycosyltransferase involved in cell wall biosynthesis